MSLGHILFCPGSSHLGQKQGGKEKGEGGWDGGRGTHVSRASSVPGPAEGFTERLH